MRRILLLSIACALYVATYAQSTPDEDIALRYRDENAVITSNVEQVEISFDDEELKAKTTAFEERLMLTELAPGLYNSANVYHNSFSKLIEIKGTTLVPSVKGFKSVKAKQFKTVKSTASGVFYDDGHQTVVTFTDLVKGAKTQTSYEIEHTDLHFLPPFYFQSYLPIAKSVFTVTCPKAVNLKWQLRGQDTSLIKFSKEEHRNSITYTWTAENLPRFKVYEDAPNVSYYMPHILIYVGNYRTGKNGSDRKMFGTVNDLYRFYYTFVRDLNKSPGAELKEIVTSVTAGAATEREKAMRIYQYVQNNIKYVAFEDGMGGFIPREASLVCNRKYGDCKDMASLLVAMCREAGVKAYYTWIGTRKKPYKYKETPLPIADNHMICTANIGDEWIFMDGTDALIPFGVPPAAIQGKEALVGLDKDNFKILKVPEIAAAQNLILDSTFIGLSDKKISGSVHINMKGYSAWNMREMMLYKNEREREDAVKAIASRGSNKYIQKSFNFKTPDNSEKDFEATSSFEVRDYSQQVGKEWYVNMNLQRSYEDLWVDGKDRKIPLERNYKSKTKQVVVMEVPKGYHVSYLPPTVEKTASDLWSYKIQYKHLGQQVHLIKEFVINTIFIQPEQFSPHNELVADLKEQYKESVVLTAD